MRRSALVGLALTAATALALWGCRKEPARPQAPSPPTPPETMTVEAMTGHTFRHADKCDSCVWTLQFGNEPPEQMGRMDSVRILLPQAGEYTLYCTAYLSGKQEVLQTKLRATPRTAGMLSHYISRVLEYRPAPGQFVNKLPKWEAGDDASAMARKATQRLAGREKGELVTLGAYGGYIVFAFDHPVRNVHEAYDVKILGNGFNGSAEPGCIRVGVDWNGNGRPEPGEWYEIAGSEHRKPESVTSYRIAYTRDTVHPYIPPKEPSIIDSAYIPWRDNRGRTGYVSRNMFHGNSYWPKWIAGDTIAFEGVRLPDNYRITKLANGQVRYFQEAYPFGYADNLPNKQEPGIKIEWATDKGGAPVELPMIDFVMVYTGVNQYCGPLGETSTEISGGIDLNTPK